MKLIVGLGNPGEKYANTRHNVGFLFVDRLQSAVYRNDIWESQKKHKSVVCNLKSVDCILVKPQTFMNESGVSVLSLTTFYKIPTANLYVVHDDLDIKLGEYKIQFGVGPKVHGGVSSIENTLGTINFWRVRVGVDNRDPQNRTPGERYVLERFTTDEMTVVNKTIDIIAEDMLSILNSQISTLES